MLGEPKFSCGDPCAGVPAGRACQIWSVGSDGLTSFEESIRVWASCAQRRVSVHTLDPTIGGDNLCKLRNLQAAGVLDFHGVGLGASDGVSELTVRKGSSFEVATMRTLYARLNTSCVPALRLEHSTTRTQHKCPLNSSRRILVGVVASAQGSTTSRSIARAASSM